LAEQGRHISGSELDDAVAEIVTEGLALMKSDRLLSLATPSPLSRLVESYPARIAVEESFRRYLSELPGTAWS
jgi:hypothetical protein